MNGNYSLTNVEAQRIMAVSMWLPIMPDWSTAYEGSHQRHSTRQFVSQCEQDFCNKPPNEPLLSWIKLT